MNLYVVECECGNPKPHRKFEGEDGRLSGGFFSVAEGSEIIGSYLEDGDMSREEFLAVEAELRATDLPEFLELSEEELKGVVQKATVNPAVWKIDQAKREELFCSSARFGGISPEQIERMVQMLRAAAPSQTGEVVDNPSGGGGDADRVMIWVVGR